MKDKVKAHRGWHDFNKMSKQELIEELLYLHEVYLMEEEE